MAKFDRDLNTIWVDMIYGDDYARITSLKHDKSGSLYLTGSFNSKIQVADTTLISKGYTDIFIVKYRSDGKMEWEGALVRGIMIMQTMLMLITSLGEQHTGR